DLLASPLDNPERLVQFERKNCLGLDADVSLRQGLSRHTAAAADTGADGCPFGAAENGTDDAAHGGAAADEFRRALVRADSLLALLFEVLSAERVLPAVDRDRREIQDEIILAANLAALADRPDDHLRLRASRDYHLALCVLHWLGHVRRECLTVGGSAAVDP